MTTDAQPIRTTADAIAAGHAALRATHGGLCALSATALRLLVDAATRDEAHRVDLADHVPQEPPSPWLSAADFPPDRNTQVIYWHRSETGGFPAIADEWRDEHHARFASHWLPHEAPRGVGEGTA